MQTVVRHSAGNQQSQADEIPTVDLKLRNLFAGNDAGNRPILSLNVREVPLHRDFLGDRPNFQSHVHSLRLACRQDHVGLHDFLESLGLDSNAVRPDRD